MPPAARILPIVLLALAACNPPRVREGEVVVAEGTLPVSFEAVADGATARLDTLFEAAVTGSAAWDTLRPRLHFRRPPAPVDFEGAMLLVAAVRTPASGYALRFDSIEEEADGVVATYTVFTPGTDCFTDAIPQQPFQVVRLRRFDVPVRFRRHDEPLRCTLGRW